MSTIDELGTYIDAQSTVFTLGNNLFKGYFDVNSPDTCAVLIDILGFEPPIDTYGASGSYNWERPQIQVLSRAGSDDYQTARNNSEHLYKLLRNVYGTLSGVKYHLINIRSSPYYQGEDNNGRHLISFTIDCWKDTSS